MQICGVDEAGRGPLAGPVVVASVIFNDDFFIEGVRDSKKLISKKREELFQIIIEKCISHKISIIDHHIIDKVNILKATMLGMKDALSMVNGNIKIFIDGNYFKFDDDSHLKYNYDTIIKGDDLIPVISCASILAKVTRDKIMNEYDKIYHQYKLGKNKGYPTKDHIELIRKYGICPIHRKTFCEKFVNTNV
jgi:ribonuclease HII